MRELPGDVEAVDARFPGSADSRLIGVAAEDVSSHRLVRSAHIQAGAAAHAVESFTQHGVIPHGHPAVVEQDEVKAALTLHERRPRPPGTGDQRQIAAQQLARRGAWQQLQKRLQVGQRRDQFLDPGERHVNPRHLSAEPPIPLVFDNHDRSRLGDDEVGAGDAEIRGKKVLPKKATRELRQSLRSVRNVLDVGASAKRRADVFDALVEDGREEVRRPIVIELDDVLPQIGLPDVHLPLLQSGVEMNFLRSHRLRLHRPRASLG